MSRPTAASQRAAAKILNHLDKIHQASFEQSGSFAEQEDCSLGKGVIEVATLMEKESRLWRLLNAAESALLLLSLGHMAPSREGGDGIIEALRRELKSFKGEE